MKWIPKILSLLCLWGALIAVTIFVEPDLLKDIFIQNSYFPYVALLGITIWYTIAVILKSMSKSLVLTTTIMLGIVLSMMKLMHIGLLFALLLTLVIESWYIYHRHEKIKPTNEQKNRDASL